MTQGGETAWFHLVGKESAEFVVARHAPDARYVITELAVTGAQSARAASTAHRLTQEGTATWRIAGPNCSTTALHVLRNAGVVVPEWSRTPFLLSAGVRAGSEVTVLGGAAATVAPAAAGSN